MAPLRRVADQPTWLLGRANARSQRILAEAFNAAGARGYQFRILAGLEQHGPSSQADLGRNTGIDRSDVVATVNELVTKGFVRRDPDPDDRRRNIITLTPNGCGALEQLDRVVHGAQDRMLAPLSPDERSTLVALLAKLVDAEE